MPASDRPQAPDSARALTLAACMAFVPVGIVTVLLGPMLPTLSARWSLNYSQAGALFTAQYVASTLAVAVSGALASRWGFRLPIKSGLVLTAAGVALLLAGPRLLGIISIAAYGAGLGLTVPAANLLVAEVNPERRSATLNLLNFCWSAGAVACPFLVAAAAKSHRVPLLLGAVAVFSLLVAIGIAVMPSWIKEPAAPKNQSGETKPAMNWRHGAVPALAALFFIYVGTENAIGGWVASYSKALGSMTAATAVITPAFFYSSLMLGRWLAPLLLRKIADVRLVQIGLVVACAGMAGLVLSHDLLGVGVSACLAGLGLSGVYPITISMLSHEFGSEASRVGSVMFTLSNLGGASLPWVVGVASNRFGTLKAGLAVPLIGGAAMILLFLREWKPASPERPA
ncbi:putative Transporter, major facilitator family [Candidatus Sulfotelmatobacter kueseliae]|uniref:Putative Transporter, major facilitator family n=1 Tax=Candidatus Sulfotelmatobacter kueseliae TaxID=2042962 RepID=A0A2U3K669_9BACT|nr:putative Transporter, major facilitator family [Candidatus Sulfotelmatobacter kueseliae]